MKVFVFVAALLCLSVVTHAQCVVAEKTWMYTDINRMYAMSRVSPRLERVKTIITDWIEGVAIEVPAGTRLYDVGKINQDVSRVRVRKANLFALTSDIHCR